MLRQADPDIVLNYLSERFEIPPEPFKGYIFFETGRSIWMITSTMADPIVIKSIKMKRIEFPGIRILRKVGRHLKPTTYALQLFGHKASKHTVELSRQELTELLKRGFIERSNPNWQDGYIIAFYKGTVLGCLLYRGGRLKHQFPRGRTDALVKSGLY